MGFIRAYLRVSTEEQDVMRAKKEIDDFAQLYNQKIAAFYYEKFAGTFSAVESFKIQELTNWIKAS